VKRLVIGAAVLALGIAGMSAGSAAPAVTKITGGGQTLVPTDGGAGDTIAFSAQTDGTAEGVKGQFQYVDRTGGTGAGQTVYHGTVTCVALLPSDGPNVGVIGGTSTEGIPFRIDVIDNGSGKAHDDANGTDLIVVRQGAAAQDGGDDGTDTALCDDEDETADADLSRGNVTIHKAKG
jgi:hypothetical protein